MKIDKTIRYTGFGRISIGPYGSLDFNGNSVTQAIADALGPSKDKYDDAECVGRITILIEPSDEDAEITLGNADV